MKSSSSILWLDLEMTGLDPAKDLILEIACVLTDSQLKLIAQGPDLVIHAPQEVLSGMGQWCINQHGKSGLTQAAQNSSINIIEAEHQTLEFLKEYCEPRTALLAGNSVWQDRLFLQRYMPRITEFLHYKLIDVTSVKELVNRWYPKNQYAKFEKKETHRALTDVYESLAELQHYRTHFFIQS